MLFEITKRSPRPVNSLLTPAAAALRGIAMQESATAGTAELADGTKPFAGFMTRPSELVRKLEDLVYERIELPFICNQDGSFEFAEQVIAEGADYIDSGITVNTALKTPCMFAAGKFAVATAGKWSEYTLVENAMTPDVAGNVRARFALTAGHIVPS